MTKSEQVITWHERLLRDALAAAEALSYNGLVQGRPEIVRVARDGVQLQPQHAALFDEAKE